MKHFKFYAAGCACLLLFGIVCLCVFLLNNKVDSKMPARYQENEGVLNATKTIKHLEKVTSAVISIAEKYTKDKDNVFDKLSELFLKLIYFEDLRCFVSKSKELARDSPMFGLDMINCIENKEDDIKEVYTTLSNNLKRCFAEKLENMTESYSDLLVDMQVANKVLKDLIEKMEVKEDQSKVDIKVPPEVIAAIDKATGTIQEVDRNLLKCGYDNNNPEIMQGYTDVHRSIENCFGEDRKYQMALVLMFRSNGDCYKQKNVYLT